MTANLALATRLKSPQHWGRGTHRVPTGNPPQRVMGDGSGRPSPAPSHPHRPIAGKKEKSENCQNKPNYRQLPPRHSAASSLQ
jgi:hypothetical protein